MQSCLICNLIQNRLFLLRIYSKVVWNPFPIKEFYQQSNYYVWFPQSASKISHVMSISKTLKPTLLQTFIAWGQHVKAPHNCNNPAQYNKIHCFAKSHDSESGFHDGVYSRLANFAVIF